MTATITSGQKKQIMRIGQDVFEKALEAALAEAGLSKEQAQRAIEAGVVPMDDLKSLLLAGLIKLGRGRYANEEVESSFAYPNGYLVKPLPVQIATLSGILGLDGKQALAYVEKLPEQPTLAEGWFAIPRWQALAETYGQALEKLFKLIAQRRRFKNWLESKILDERCLRQHEYTVQCFERIEKSQPGDILVVPGQFGMKHRGRSVRRGRELYTPTEFGLGSFHCGSMLLTHPEREQVWEQLHIDCAGDEYSPGAGGRFGGAPSFSWGGGGLHFDGGWVVSTDERFGSASGFLPPDLC